MSTLEMPAIGLGTWKCQSPEEVVYQSIKDGVRLIDTASVYKVEEGVGKGIAKAIKEGIVKREELFVVTKTFVNERNDPEISLKNSLQRLNLTYVDLYLDHWPTLWGFSKDSRINKDNCKLVPMHVVWEKLEGCVEKGLTRFIGVSNYNVQSLYNLLSFCKIKPYANQVEFHPYLYQKNLKDFCDKVGIKVMAYCPLFHTQKNNLCIFEDETLKKIAAKNSKTIGQIILAWHLAVGTIPIPGTSNPQRMKENLGSLQFKLTPEEIEEIAKLHKGIRVCDSLGFGGGDVFA